MPVARLPALTTLVLALLLGAAPWRVCAHGDHGGIWVPAVHAHGTGSGHSASGHACRAGSQRDTTPVESACGTKSCRHGHGRAHHAHAGCGHRCTPSRAPVTSLPPAQQAPPDAPEGPCCHCDDQPLVAQPLSLPVEVAAPSLLGWAHVTVPTTARTGATEVAPGSSEGCRVPCESDSVVLVR